MNDEEILKRHIIDLANKAYSKNIYTNTGFLNLAEQSLFLSEAGKISFIEHTLFGGSEHSERRIIIFGSENDTGYEKPNPIKLMRIVPKSHKFAEKLSHRDYLGAILNLGIERSLIGDIIVKDKEAFFYCIDTIAPFLKENLKRVRHTDVFCEESFDAPKAEPLFEEIEVNVASERADAIVSVFCQLSRAEAEKLFCAQRVFLNSKVLESTSKTLKVGDVLSVRGFGKAIYRGILRQTKKGRYFVGLKKYI